MTTESDTSSNYNKAGLLRRLEIWFNAPVHTYRKQLSPEAFEALQLQATQSFNRQRRIYNTLCVITLFLLVFGTITNISNSRLTWFVNKIASLAPNQPGLVLLLLTFGLAAIAYPILSLLYRLLRIRIYHKINRDVQFEKLTSHSIQSIHHANLKRLPLHKLIEHLFPDQYDIQHDICKKIDLEEKLFTFQKPFPLLTLLALVLHSFLPKALSLNYNPTPLTVIGFLSYGGATAIHFYLLTHGCRMRQILATMLSKENIRPARCCICMTKTNHNKAACPECGQALAEVENKIESTDAAATAD